MAVPLGRSVEPNETIEIELAWTARSRGRSPAPATSSDYYFIAQWFPKLGVLEDSGWNTHQFHAATEFYADFGVYDVRITVPRRSSSAPSGRRIERARTTPTARPPIAITRRTSTTSRGRRARLHRSHADVRASDAAAGRDAAAAAARAPRPGGPLLRATEADAEALRRMVRRLSVRPRHSRRPGVPEPERRHGYPTLFTGRARWLAPRSRQTPEMTVAHEVGHQWWYGMVGTNEFEHAWMDEGINTYAHRAGARRGVHRQSRGSCATSAASSRGRFATSRSRASTTIAWRAIATTPKPTCQCDADVPLLAGDGRDHHLQQDGALAAHARAASRLADDAADHGHLLRALEFKHPQPADFFEIVNEVSGQDLRGSSTGLSQLQHLRLRRPGSRERTAGRGHVSDDGRRAALRRGDVSGRRRHHVRRRPSDHREAGTGSTGARSTCTNARPARRPCRSIHGACCCSTSPTRTTAARSSRAAARPASNGRLQVDGLAAGPDAHVCVLCSARAGSAAFGSRVAAAARWACLRDDRRARAAVGASRCAGCSQAHLGASLAAEGAANGVNYDWWQEFTSQATGLGTTFSPTIIGFAATLDNISSLLDAQREIAPIAGRSRCISRAGPSSPAASSIAMRGNGPSARQASLLHRACTSSGCCAWPSCRVRATGGCSPTSTRGCFSSGSPIARARCPSNATCSSGASSFYVLFGALLVVDQRDLRLREDPHRGGGSPQRARCAVGARFDSSGGSAGVWLALRAERPGVPACSRCGPWLRPASDGRAVIWLGVPRRAALLVARLAMKLQFLASRPRSSSRASRTRRTPPRRCRRGPIPRPRN